MIRPMRDLLKVLVKEEEEEKKTASGIYLPDTIGKGDPAKPLVQGLVVDVGPGYTNPYGQVVTSDYVEGDVVMFKNHPLLDKVFDEGQSYLLVPSAEVCALVEDVIDHE